MPKRMTPYITQFFNRDKLAFNALSKCGHVSTAQLKQCGLADARMKNYVRDGLAEKIIYKDGKELKEAYKLTKDGRDLALKNWGAREHYHAQSPKHDLALAEKYFSLTEEQKETFITETQARDLFMEKIQDLRGRGEMALSREYEEMLNKGLISMPDGIYTNEKGLQVAFEVITNNYGPSELQAKETFVEIMQTQYETTRV